MRAIAAVSRPTSAFGHKRSVALHAYCYVSGGIAACQFVACS